MELPRINGGVIVQGGMGVGVSMPRLAGAVAREGGVGIVSGVALNEVHKIRTGKSISIYEATRIYLQEAMEFAKGGFIGINVMYALEASVKDVVRGAVDAGVHAIFAGAGLPMDLPKLADNPNVMLLPIVSSGRALGIIAKRWKSRYNRIPDAVVLEGPMAGGHLGFSAKEIKDPKFQLEEIYPEVKSVADQYGCRDVVVAGGIYFRQDIISWLKRGASGVQMGTRFAATEESDASAEFKKAIVAAKKGDIIIAKDALSPCRMMFRLIGPSSLGYHEAVNEERAPLCTRGYVLMRDRITGTWFCPATEAPKPGEPKHFCICENLLSAISPENYPSALPIFTVGTNGYLVNRIMPVAELMAELTDKP